MSKLKRFKIKVELEGKTIVTTEIPVMARTATEAWTKVERMSNKRLMLKANRQLGKKRLWTITDVCFI